MEKYLSLPKEGAVLAEISDIGEVAEDDLADEYTTIADAEVVGVVSIDSYLACIACKCKVETTSEKLGKCTKCNVVQCSEHCMKQLSLKLIISAGAAYLTVMLRTLPNKKRSPTSHY